MSEAVKEMMSIVVTPETAQEVYPQKRRPRPDQRQPLDWSGMANLPEEFVGPVRAVASRCRVWAYLLQDGIGVEVRNTPLRSHHKPLRVS